MNRLRRLCSRNSDFKEAIKGLELRCINSGYQKKIVTDILSSAGSLTRDLVTTVRNPQMSNISSVRLVTLAGSPYIDKFIEFASRMNRILLNSDIRISIVQCTSAPISRLLFNNGNTPGTLDLPVNDRCAACRNDMINDTGIVKSNVTGNAFKVDTNLNCSDGGIYIVDTTCSAQYTGRTIHFGVRSNEHFVRGGTAISLHIQDCNICESAIDFKLTLVENHLKKGKYSLSEREYLWNNRFRGSINTQKTLGT